jgi:hypothetical protein
MDVFDKLKFWKDKHSNPNLDFDLDSANNNNNNNNAPSNDLNINENMGHDNTNNINKNYPGSQQDTPNLNNNMDSMNSQTDFMSGVNSPMDYSQDDFYSKESNDINNPQSSVPFNNNMNAPQNNNNMDLNQDMMPMGSNFNPNSSRSMDEMSNMGLTSRPAGEFVSDNKRGLNTLPNNPTETNNQPDSPYNSTQKFELINSKLDTIKAMLDHLNQRMVNIENKINNDNQRW